MKGLLLVVTAVATCGAIVNAFGYAVALVMALDAIAGVVSVACVLSAVRITDQAPWSAWLTLFASLLPPVLILIATCAGIICLGPWLERF